MDFFVIEKIVLCLILPPSSLIILMAAGVFVMKKRPRIGKVVVAAGIFILYLFSIKPVSNLLLMPLESRFQPLENISSEFEGYIVILAHGVLDLPWLSLNPAPDETSLSRLASGIALYNRNPDSAIIISGGSGNPEKPHIPESDAMKDAAVSLGVPARDIMIENVSRNTVENASSLLTVIGNKKRIILVTSAYHTKRSVALFEKMGFDVIPAPCDYKSEQKNITFYSFLPYAVNLLNSSTAISEYMAIFWYMILPEIQIRVMGL